MAGKVINAIVSWIQGEERKNRNISKQFKDP